jgi:hypothetical protein
VNPENNAIKDAGGTQSKKFRTQHKLRVRMLTMRLRPLNQGAEAQKKKGCHRKTGSEERALMSANPCSPDNHLIAGADDALMPQGTFNPLFLTFCLPMPKFCLETPIPVAPAQAGTTVAVYPDRTRATIEIPPASAQSLNPPSQKLLLA